MNVRIGVCYLWETGVLWLRDRSVYFACERGRCAVCGGEESMLGVLEWDVLCV